MKWILLAVLYCAVLLEAYPLFGHLVGKGIGSGVGSGLGNGIGTGVGLGISSVESIVVGTLGLDLGAAQLGSGIIEGVETGFANALGAGLSLAGVGKGGQSKSVSSDHD